MSRRILVSLEIVHEIPDWDVQLAGIFRKRWLNAAGECIFPYPPLTNVNGWRDEMLAGWMNGTIHSFALVLDGRIASHAALLLHTDGRWEMGRLASDCAGKEGTALVCHARRMFALEHGIEAMMECTQAHTRAQHHADGQEMRMAGIGTLDGHTWHIIYTDTLRRPNFVPRRGVIGDPLGVEIPCDENAHAFLRHIQPILTTDKDGPLPPTHFHVLPKWMPIVREIIRVNT